MPCLTCGSTRMLDALLAGDFAEAVMWSPLVFLGPDRDRLGLPRVAWRLRAGRIRIDRFLVATVYLS